MHLTQEALARVLGVDVRSVIRYEMGQSRVPKVTAIAMTCLAKHKRGKTKNAAKH